MARKTLPTIPHPLSETVASDRGTDRSWRFGHLFRCRRQSRDTARLNALWRHALGLQVLGDMSPVTIVMLSVHAVVSVECWILSIALVLGNSKQR